MVGPDFLNDLRIAMYSTPIFSQIREDVQPENIKYINFDELQSIYLVNDRPSDAPQQEESVEDIKNKAPQYFTSRDRLVTTTDYEVYIQRNFGNVIKDTRIIENKDFVDGHLKYLSEDIGITYPNLESRVMMNHLPYASTTTYNNIYIYAVPTTEEVVSVTSNSRFLSEAQRSAILSSIESNKMISHEPVIMDPVYILAAPCLSVPGEQFTTDLNDKTRIKVIKTVRTSRDDAALKQEISQAIYTYFTKSKLGMLVNIRELVDVLLNISGVDQIKTCRSDIQFETDGLSLAYWNPIYETDFTISTQNVQLPYFKYVTLSDLTGMYDKIDIVSNDRTTETYNDIVETSTTEQVSRSSTY